jgi:hypothetical protein
MASSINTIRRFGPPQGAAGLSVIETIGSNIITGQQFGGTVFWGALKRGEPSTYVPCRSYREYLSLFGDANNLNWHLYDNGQLTPDAIESYFNQAGDTGLLWVCRLGLDNKGKKASVTLKSRLGNEVLKVTAANVGRWGGYYQTTGSKAVVVATPVTFTLVAPGTEANEYIGAKVAFSSGTSQEYDIVANTAAIPSSGEVIFTVSPQFNLLSDGVNGPTSLSGTATYARRVNIPGTVSAPSVVDATGTVTISGTVLAGNGTTFNTEFTVGANVYYQGEARVVQSVSSATTLTIDSPFTVTSGTGLVVQKDNFILSGNENFTSDLVGKDIYVTISGTTYAREVAAFINSDQIRLTSSFPVDIPPGSTAQKDNYLVDGTSSIWGDEVNVGDQIIDPARQGEAVTVIEIISDTSFRVATQFSSDFTSQSLVKQTQKATVTLTTPNNEGLQVVVTPGTKSAATEFNLDVIFNGSKVYSKENLSLDPASPNFIEPIVNDGNLAYQFGSTSVYSYITVESLHNGAYTTNPVNDVRPVNGVGNVLLALANRLYTDADIDYTASVGQNLYPNPYLLPRNTLQIKSSSPVKILEGTISSEGVDVYGTGTDFIPTLVSGDYIVANGQIRRVRVVVADTYLILYSAFATDLPALTVAKKAGYLQVDRGTDLAPLTGTQAKFMVSYPTPLVGGYDGDLSSIIPYHYTQYFDPSRDDLEKTVSESLMGLIRIATPGNSGSEVSRALAAFAESHAFEARIEIPSLYADERIAETYIRNEVGNSDFISVAFPSYGYISNPKGGGYRLISATGEIIGRETSVANVNRGWHVPAAGEQGRLSRFLKMTADISSTGEALLNSSGIQPIKRLRGVYTIYGARVPAVNPSYDFLHIRRIQSNYIWILRKSRNILNQLFRPNDPSTAYQLEMILSNFFREEYRNGVLNNYLTVENAFSIRTDSPNAIAQAISNNDSGDILSSLINGNLGVYISYVPTGITETIYIYLGPKLTTQN